MKEKEILRKNSISMMFATVISRIFGLIRVQVITFLLGTTRSADIWGIAFLIPNLIRRLIAEGAMTAAFVPLLSTMDSSRRQIQFSRQIFTVVLITSSLLSLIMILLLPYILPRAISMNSALGSQDVLNVIGPSQLVFPFLVFACVNAICYSILNVRGKFFFPAITPVVLSISMISGGIIAWKCRCDPVWGLAAGVLVGGFGQFLLVWFVLYRDGVFLFPQKIIWSPQLRKTLIWWFPTTIGAGIFQINLLLSRSASFNLFEGAVAALDYSTMLTELALGIFTTSITTAMLPLLVKPKSAGMNPEEQVMIQEGIINISFIIIPGTVGLLLAGFPLIGILFRHGQFDEWSQVITYGALLPGAMMLIPLSWYRILAQLFYAQGKVRALLIMAVLATFFNVIGLFTLPALFPENISHLGINLSLLIYSWCLYVSVSIYAGIRLGFRWKKATVLELGKNLLASMCIIPVWWPLRLQNEGIFAWFIKVAVSILIYLAVSGIFKASGMSQLKNRL